MKKLGARIFEKGFPLICALLVLTCGSGDDSAHTLTDCPVGRTGSSIVRFAWDANSEPDLAGYWLYQSRMTGQYSESKRVCKMPAGVETCEVGPLSPGAYFWVLTAFDTSLNESGYSEEVSDVIR